MVESCLVVLIANKLALFLFQGISQLLKCAAMRAGQSCPGLRREWAGRDDRVRWKVTACVLKFTVLTELTRSLESNIRNISFIS